ncbi:ALL2 protein, partial [Crocuta crocuta]
LAPQRGPLLLLTLSLGLACAQKTLEEVPVQPGFDAQKGRWLTVRLAASRAHLVSPDDPLRLGLHSLRTRDGDMEFVLFWTGEGVCQGVTVTVHPTGLQGQFHGSCEWPSPPGRVLLHAHFVSTDYSRLILYVRLEDAGEVTSLWALLARRKLGDPAWLRKYCEYVRGFQLHEAPVFNLDGKCCPPD